MGKTAPFQNCTTSALPPGLKTRFEREQVMSVSFSPDGTRIAAGGDGRIWIYDTLSGTQFAMLSDYTELVRALAFAPDNSLLASGSTDSTLRFWDTTAAREVLTLAGDSNLINALAASSPDGVPMPGWDPRTERLLAASPEDPGRIRSLAFSPDGATLASGSADGKIRLWEVETGRLRSTFSAHDGLVLALAFSPDSETLTSGGSDTLIRRWEFGRQHLISVLRGHTASVNALAFSTDAELLVSGGRDACVQLWEMDDADPIATFQVEEYVQALAFSADDEKLMYVTQAGSLFVRER